MTTETYELLEDTIKMLCKWQEDFSDIPLNYKTIINRFSIHILSNTNLVPPDNLRQFFSFIKTNPINKIGFELGQEYDDICLIDGSGHVEYKMVDWLENVQSQDDIDQQLMREFLKSCREEYLEKKDSRILELYTETRKFINPSNYHITLDRINKFINKYSHISKSVKEIKDWYEDFDHGDILYCCPVCGKDLSYDLFKEARCTDMCMYYREKNSLNIVEKKLDKKLKYKKLKKGLYTYTLLPGISELRIYEDLVNLYGEENVFLYPDIDKYDISIKLDGVDILLDVKDVKSPYDLINILLENKILQEAEPASGRRAAMYKFELLLNKVRV